MWDDANIYQDVKSARCAFHWYVLWGYAATRKFAQVDSNRCSPRPLNAG